MQEDIVVHALRHDPTSESDNESYYEEEEREKPV